MGMLNFLMFFVLFVKNLNSWVLLPTFLFGSAENVVSIENVKCPLALQIIQAKPAAAGHLPEELEKDLKILLLMWDGIVEHAKSAVQAAQLRIPGAVPAMLHRGIDHNLAAIYDYFPDKVISNLFLFSHFILK
jgi:hypothetical protein